MRLRALTALAVVGIAVAGTQLSGAVFVAQKSNPSNTFAAAASFCASPGSSTVKAVRDTYIDQSSPSSNYGTSSDLFVMSKSGNANRRTLVGFTLPSIPSGCSVTQAQLRVYSTSAVSGRTIGAYRANSSWTETGATWNNANATTGTAATAASGTGWRTWTVTAQTQALYSGTNNGFILRDQTEGAAASPEQKYQSRQGTPDTQDPELIVTWG